MKIICVMNDTYNLPLAVHWEVIKCPMITDTVALGSGRRLADDDTAISTSASYRHNRKYSSVGEDVSDDFESEVNF